MTLQLHVQIVGALLLSLGIAHSLFSRYFGWEKELVSLSVLTRRIFWVHCFFIALILAMLGVCSLFYTDVLLEPTPLSRVLLVGIVAFWLCRLAIQFLVYDSAIWRGRPFYTFMNVVFSLFWFYVVITYSLALHRVWNG
jgi:hypothetical protein